MEPIQIVYNAVAAKVVNPNQTVDLSLQQILSYHVAGYEQTDAYQTGAWDGRSSFYEMRHHRFPSGFVPIVHRSLTNLGFKVSLRRKPLPPPRGPEKPEVDKFGYDDERYAYQLDTTAQLVKHGRMIAQVATGGGKSRIAQIATARIGRPTLFLTTRKVLMYQMQVHFQNMIAEMGKYHPSVKGKPVGVLGDGDWEPKGWINVGMVQTIAARLKQPSSSDAPAKQKAQMNRIAKTRELLERFEFVILEEAHEASGNSYYDILKRCKNAEYRLALTATPFMKDDEEANMNLMACAGPIGIRVSEKQLIDSGILAKPYFKYLTPYPKPKYLLRTTGWGPAYRLGIVENTSRNALILREAIMGHKAGLSVLVLVKQKKHGKLLEQAFKNNGMRTKFIFGESTRKVRTAALNALEKGELDVLIGSNILDVGVDVPALGMVILAAGGKAEVELRQRIGRGLRAKKKGGNVAFVVDFNDKWNKHLQKHSLARRNIVKATPGFCENILPDGEEFPYELL